MTLPDLPPPSLRLRLDTDALTHNWRALGNLSGAGTSTGAAVKADGYGLGAVRVVQALRSAGAADFFVAHWSEVPALLPHLPAQQIWVLHGPARPEDAAFARDVGVRPVINSLPQARLWLDVGGGACGLMADTGMNRLGLPATDIGDPLVGQLNVDTLISHLASADEDVPQNERQLALFADAARHVRSRRRSLSNSAGIALGPRYAFDLTRPGLALYGGVPRPELANTVRQVVHPQVTVLQVRDLSAGDTVGYNATFTAPRAMRSATVSLGYADGFLRCWSGLGALHHGDLALPILGRVSMDLVVVDCTALPDLKEGDWLDVPYDLPQAAAQCGLTQYELLTLLGNRFRRS